MLHYGNTLTYPILQQAQCVLKDLLYFIPLKKPLKNTKNSIFWSIDNDLIYEPFYLDFGPLNIACLYRFSQILELSLKEIRSQTNIKNRKVVYFYCHNLARYRSNAAVLIASYALIYLNFTLDEALDIIKPFTPYKPFRDASMGENTYRLMPSHCIKGVYACLQWNFIDFNTFDVDEYEYYEAVEHGDLSIILKQKFIAFVGPHEEHNNKNDYPHFIPEDYIDIFTKYNVGSVIRLNQPMYNRQRFIDNGFKHFDLFFIDGTTPSNDIVDKFLEICMQESGLIAIHCKAGLGRTGTLMGMYLMYYYRLTASSSIGWIRLCRPGSILGPQQHFLEKNQKKMWLLGQEHHTPGAIKYNKDQLLKKKQQQQQQQQNDQSQQHDDYKILNQTPPNTYNKASFDHIPNLTIDTSSSQGDRLNSAKKIVHLLLNHHHYIDN